VIGFINNGSDAAPAKQVEVAQPASNPALIELGYCSDTARLCVVSFDCDNAENMLITVRNRLSTLPEFFIKIKQTDSNKLYECQKVKFSPNTFYCLGDQIPVEAQVTMEVYSKSNGNLTASGSLTIHYGPVTEVASTKAPTSTKPDSTVPAAAGETPTPAYP
jgi:hypothetical protein